MLYESKDNYYNKQNFAIDETKEFILGKKDASSLIYRSISSKNNKEFEYYQNLDEDSDFEVDNIIHIQKDYFLINSESTLWIFQKANLMKKIFSINDVKDLV